MFSNFLMRHNIDTIVMQITTRCDIDGILCPTEHLKLDMKIKTFKNIIEQNSKLLKPIRNFQIEGGNPFLNKNIREIIKILQKFNYKTTLVTNGFNLKQNLINFHFEYPKKIHFAIYLDSPLEKENDFLMGNNVFKKTLESLKHLRKLGLSFEIIMRMTSYNYRNLVKMYNLSMNVGADVLAIREIYPFQNFKKIGKLLMNDNQKKEIKNKIDEFVKNKKNILKQIWFTEPENNCLYLLSNRIFINYKGNIGFCSHLSDFLNIELSNNKKHNLLDAIKINSMKRKKFIARKELEIKKWKRPREMACPCSFCLSALGFNYNW